MLLYFLKRRHHVIWYNHGQSRKESRTARTRYSHGNGVHRGRSYGGHVWQEHTYGPRYSQGL